MNGQMFDAAVNAAPPSDPWLIDAETQKPEEIANEAPLFPGPIAQHREAALEQESSGLRRLLERKRGGTSSRIPGLDGATPLQ